MTNTPPFHCVLCLTAFCKFLNNFRLLGEDTEEDFWAELNHLALEHIYAYRTPLQEVVHIVPRIPQALPMHGGVKVTPSLPSNNQFSQLPADHTESRAACLPTLLKHCDGAK